VTAEAMAGNLRFLTCPYVPVVAARGTCGSCQVRTYSSRLRFIWIQIVPITIMWSGWDIGDSLGESLPPPQLGAASDDRNQSIEEICNRQRQSSCQGGLDSGRWRRRRERLKGGLSKETAMAQCHGQSS
jgi:hypothetical protein